MKPFIKRWGHNVTVLDPNRPSCGISEKYYNKRKLECENIVKSEQTRKSKDDGIVLSDIGSNISSNSKSHEQCFNFKRPPLKRYTIPSCNEETIESSKSVFTNVRDDTYESYDGANSALSTSSIVYESDESFLPIETHEKHIGLSGINNPKDNLSFLRPLRVFNKYGKPLTDRVGRPLLNILGEQMVIFNNDGKVFSDLKGNQVFNSLGESAIYSTTNLHIPPTDDEPGIPVMDIDKKHILFLYDNKGHPLTDALGRPLNKASGRLMFGMNSGEKINLNNYKYNQLNRMYSKAPLENFVRRVQIFDSHFRPLTDEHGRLFKSAKVICNKSGMPMCDINGKQLYFKYGARIITETHTNTPEIKEHFFNTPSNSSDDSIIEKDIFDKLGCKGNEVIGKRYASTLKSSLECRLKVEDQEEEMYKIAYNNKNTLKNDVPEVVDYKKLYDKKDENKLVEGNMCKDINRNDSILKIECLTHSNEISNKSLDKDINDTHNKHFKIQEAVHDNVGNAIEKSPYFSNIESNNNNVANDELEKKQRNSNLKNIINPNKNYSKEAIVLFDASKKMARQKSSICTLTDLKNTKKRRIGHIIKKKSNRKIYTSNFIEYFKNALNLSNIKQNNNQIIFNDYGKPMKDIYGNLLYDKFGIPLTGANGIRLSEKARYTLRLKLKNIPVLPVGKVNKECGQNMVHALSYNKSHDQFGDPFYDKYGRPLYDLFGKLIYDIYGRPLTDAFGRPLIDAIGQPLMDAEGNVLTSVSNSVNFTLTDVFGRRLYDKRGKALFDSYGRPRYDIFTDAIYDSCGRPATDGNGNILFDFLNKAIQPHPEKPLYKNARALLPKYIDRILAMPSMYRVLKYSRTTLKDVFGGPLFDDFGKPLYNKFGKPLYDKYGRPLYDKDGRPLCDCYGRPLSEEIRESPNDQTLSVVDSLKLLKLTKESSKWMEIKRSQSRGLKPSNSSILDDAIVMRVVQPTKHKSTQYTYALTRVTRFSCGRQALEILEAPLSPSTASEMHHLPVDNKPLLMVARRRKRIVKRHRIIKQR